LLEVFARSETWERLRAGERRSRLGLAAAFLSSFARYFRASRNACRRHPERRVLWLPRRVRRIGPRSVWLRDTSPGRAGLLGTGEQPSNGELWRIAELRWGRVVYARRWLMLFWRVGVEEVEAPLAAVPKWEQARHTLVEEPVSPEGVAASPVSTAER